MRANPLKSCSGLTFIAALMMVVIMGIMLGSVVQSWTMIMQREREEELLFRGRQIRDAIARWYKPRPGLPQRPLMDLKYLLEDPASAEKVRYLRRLYKDPITNKDFVPIIAGATPGGALADIAQGIIGVKSASEAPPLKIGNFPDDLKDFSDKGRYTDWEFNARSQAYLASIGATPGRATPGGALPIPPIPP